MNEEIWKDVVGYEGYYQVSNLGRVRSVDRYVKHGNIEKRCKGKLIRLYKERDGYISCCLCNQSKLTKRVHRLVAQAFIPNPYNYSDINHKDETKSNNCVDNLEWCTPSYNNNYGTRLNQIRKPIICIETCECFESIKKAAQKLVTEGLSSSFKGAKSNINKALSSGVARYGYHFEYVKS